MLLLLRSCDYQLGLSYKWPIWGKFKGTALQKNNNSRIISCFTYTVFFRNWWTNVSVYIHHWFPPTQMLLGHAFWKKSDCCIMKDNTMSAFHYVEGSSWDSFSIERYIALIMWTKSVKKKMCCLFQKLHILLPIWGKDLLRINMRIWDFDCDVISVRKGWGDCCE